MEPEGFFQIHTGDESEAANEETMFKQPGLGPLVQVGNIKNNNSNIIAIIIIIKIIVLIINKNKCNNSPYEHPA